ncbi:MAG: lytic murein transglycosylase, partial [Thioalkalivibrio sp.]
MHTRSSLIWLLAPFLVALMAGSASASTDTRLDEQRALFKDTEEALSRGDRTRFQEGLKALTGYPLYSYLLYADLESRLNRAGAKEVRTFLDAHGDTPHGERLYHAWLTRLAREGRWADLTRDYDPRNGSTTLSCHHRQALLELDRPDEAFKDLDAIWLNGRSLSDACDPVLNAWREAGKLTPDLTWGRFELALEAGQPGLAGYISRYLPDSERPWADRWLNLYRQPARITRTDWTADAHPKGTAMFTQAWTRLARQDPEQALSLWEQHAQAQRLPAEAALALERTLALRLTLRIVGDSIPHLASLPEHIFDAQLREWQVRAGLAAGNWQVVNDAIDAMEPHQSKDYPWQYWKARA